MLAMLEAANMVFWNFCFFFLSLALASVWWLLDQTREGETVLRPAGEEALLCHCYQWLC